MRLYNARKAKISEMERLTDIGCFTIDSVDHGGWTIQKNLDQAPLPPGFRYSRGKTFI